MKRPREDTRSPCRSTVPRSRSHTRRGLDEETSKHGCDDANDNEYDNNDVYDDEDEYDGKGCDDADDDGSDGDYHDDDDDDHANATMNSKGGNGEADYIEW